MTRPISPSSWRRSTKNGRAGFYTGARLGDLNNLKRKDYDAERLSLRFGQAKTKHFVKIPVHPEFQK